MSNNIRESKFFKTINQTDDNVLSQRSELIAGDAEQALKEIVEALKKDIRGKRGEKLKLQDFGRKSKDSLEIVNSDFNVIQWANDLHKVSVEIKAFELELEIAQANYDDYFGVPKNTNNNSNISSNVTYNG